MLKTEEFRIRNAIKIFLPSYILILLLPLLLGVFIFFQTTTLLEQAEIEKNHSLIKQFSDSFDNQINEIKTFNTQILCNTKLQILYTFPREQIGNHVFDLISARDSLPSYPVFSSFISDYFVLLNNNEITLNNELIYSYRDFYEMLSTFQEEDYDSWYSAIKNTEMKKGLQKMQPVEFKENKQEMLIYADPISNYGEIVGYILTYIDSAPVDELLHLLELSDGDELYITDQGGNQIFSCNLSEEEPASEVSEKKILTEYTSRKTGLKIMFLQPSQKVFAKLNGIKFVIAIVFVATFLVGLFLVIYFSYWNSKTFSSAYRLLTLNKPAHPEGKHSSSNYIQSIFSSFANDYSEMKSTVHLQKPFLRSYLLSRLLQDSFKNEEEILCFAESLNLNFDAKFYAVGIVQIVAQEILEDLSLLMKEKDAIKKQLADRLSPDAAVCELELDKLVFLLEEKTRTKEQFSLSIRELFSRFSAEEAQSCVICVGGIYDSLSELRVSCKEALDALKRNALSPEYRFFFFYEITQSYAIYYFPYELQCKLENIIKSGNESLLLEELRRLYQKNVMESNLSHDIVDSLIIKLYLLLLELTNELVIPDQLREKIFTFHAGERSSGEASKIHEINSLYFEVCGWIAGQKEKEKNDKIDKINKYIFSHFSDSDLSLAKIANVFGLSESYLSTYFKQQNGENFSTYLEKLRLNHSTELLAKTDLAIGEISLLCGYLSVNTFTRAFRRMYGINATTYRKNQNKTGD